MELKKIIKSKIFYVICSLIGLAVIINYYSTSKYSFAQIPKNILVEPSSENQVVYLSDIPYLKAEIGWKTIGLDKTNDNAALVMRIDNSSVVVKKGIWAHATSTVEYDISNYKDYDYFTTYYGLNTSAGNTGNGVKFYIYTSTDGKNWTLRTEENPTPLKGVNNAVRVKIDIKDANYIRLYANDNGSNASDHAVWGDAKLVKEGYSDNVMMPVEEFDKIIKENYQSGTIKDDLTLFLLQRNFIKNFGQYQLRSFIESDSKNYETLEWFLNNEEALRLWTVGGKPSGSYEKSLQVLSNLYHAHKEDLSNENVTSLGTKYKDLYLRMMLSLSLTHSGSVGLWTDIRQQSNALNRYEIYKQMHKNGLLDNAMFESYTIDEMRGVMATNIDDEEILWLHDYSKKFPTTAERFNPYKYIKYTLNYGYYRPQYYSQENYAMWDKKYNLSKYNVPYKAGSPKLWIVFEEGAVCGGLSKTACNLYGVWGYPARVVGQPGHAAYVYLYNAGGGKYAWQLANSVASTGWANTTGAGYNGWGNRYATNNGNIKTGSYLLLSQEAQNEYEKYEKAQLILLLEDVYKNDRKKLEQIYRDVLKEEIINLDAWIGLVNLYIADNSKTEAQLIELAEEIAEVYTYHPLPMYDLTRRIGSKITSAGYRSRLMMLHDETLRKATKATSKETIYHKEVPVIANALLGVVDSRVATFSFDGANAGQIVLSKQLQSAQVSWTYSLDGGKTWIDCFEHSAQLTNKQLESITAENDIKIHITGLPMTEANIYTIDILKGEFPSNSVSIDDLENRIMGATNKMEWTLDPNGEWNSFADTNPIFKGDVKVYVRMLATGVYTMSNQVYYTFTTNTSSESHRYIPRSNLNVIAVSGTSGGNKNYIIDGNVNTAWHSYYNKNSLGQKYIASYATIELEKPKYISELDYVPHSKATSALGKYPTGKASRLDIYVSMDGTNWELAATKSNLGNNYNLKKITFAEPILAKYVRINCPSVYESGLQHFFSIALINLYEDPSASEVPTAEVNYNITSKTNKNVVAELIDENRPITVTNNGGKTTHTFTENGEFTFEFVDRNGNKGTATAKVDWIDKTPPKVDVKFNTTEITNENVVATLIFDKKVTILSEDVQVSENPVDKSKTITFLENDTFELKFADELGNIGSKTITVDWIDTKAPTAEFEFNTTHLTDGNVVATLKPSEEVTVTNNGGKDTYTFTDNGEFTFEFVDKAGNKGTATVYVNWIAKLPKYEIKYSTESLTNQDVKVTLELEDGYRIFNNNANKDYIFTENGTFNFQYKDKYGNDGLIPVTVDWIDKVAPTGEFEYSTNKWTNKNVVVTLKPSEEVTITNNNGKNTYTFTKNGEFTFEFVDKVGNKGTATAKVNWIDIKAPTAVIEYSTKDSTEDPVVVTLKPSEEVTVTNNGGKTTYTFTKNGEFTFEFADKAGNKGTATAKVDWIEKKSETKPDDKPGTNEPDKPDDNTTNKPGNNNQNNSNNNNNKPGTSDNSNNSNKPNTNTEYKKYSSDKIEVEIPANAIKEEGTLKVEDFKLPEELIGRFGDLSEYFNINLTNTKSETIDINSNDPIKINIKLNNNSEFIGVFEITSDNTIKLVDYVKNGENIEITSKNLGKFVVSYKKKEVEIAPKKEYATNQSKIVYILLTCSIIIVLSAVIYFYKKKKAQ